MFSVFDFQNIDIINSSINRVLQSLSLFEIVISIDYIIRIYKNNLLM
jgi:hypothetical protein